MNVWVVNAGCRYEGGGIEAVFSTMDKADEFARNLAEKNNKDTTRYYMQNELSEVCAEWLPKLLFRQNESGDWETSSDYISVREWQVQ